MANKRKDITGNRYDKLVAVRPLHTNHRGLWQWEFKCDCGNTLVRSITFTSKLKPNQRHSCGCDHHLKTHGISHKNKKLYWVWVSIRQRCFNPKNKDYPNYGGRGITICGDWSDYSVFHDWALSSGYKGKVTIERVDVNGDYEPSNCTWVVNEKQALNTRKVRLFKYKGEYRTLRELSEISGVKLNTMKTRLTNLNWSVERAMGDE